MRFIRVIFFSLRRPELISRLICLVCFFSVHTHMSVRTTLSYKQEFRGIHSLDKDNTGRWLPRYARGVLPCRHCYGLYRDYCDRSRGLEYDVVSGEFRNT